jgi:hypothetical protein
MNRLIGIISIAAPILHLFTDILEVFQSGFSVLHLSINYIAFILIPIMIIGLFAIQRPHIGWLGFIGSIGYAIAFIYFASTTTYALLQKIPNYEILISKLGLFYTINGGLMIICGIIFGIEIIRIKVFPLWTGIVLIAGLLINLTVAVLPVSPIIQILGSTARNVAFIGMGLSIVIKKY